MSAAGACENLRDLQREAQLWSGAKRKHVEAPWALVRTSLSAGGREEHSIHAGAHTHGVCLC